MKIWFLFFGLFAYPILLKGQSLPVSKEQIDAYLNLIHTNPEQIPMVEGRMSYELKDSLTFAYLKSSILKRMEENPEETSLLEILAWTYVQEKQFSKALIQYMALDKINREDGVRVLNLGKISIQNQDYETANKAFNYILELVPKSRYYRITKYEQINALKGQILGSAYKISELNTLHTIYKNFLSEFTQGAYVINVKLNLAKFDIEYLDKLDEASLILKEVLGSPEANSLFKAQSKMELARVNVLKGNIWEAALLLGQVHSEFKDEPMGQDALFEASKLYYYAGDFTLAKSQLDVLKTATSELTSNDAIDLSLLIQKNLEEDSSGKALKVFAHSELLIYQHKYQEAERLMDSILKKYPGNSLKDDILMARFKIHFSEKDYSQAALNLQTILDQFPNGIWADDALFHLAELNENQFKLLPKARSLYEKLFLIYPGSYFAGESRKRFRNLVRDTIN